MTNRKPELVVAMDISDKTEAFNLARKLGEKPVILKIGWMLYPYIGHDGLIELSEMFNGRLFLDFKLHDIPSVIANGVESLMKTVNFQILTLHTAGGKNMMEGSVEVRDSCFSGGSRCTKKPLLLGVTVLTSMDSSSLQQIGSSFESPDDAVLALATLAHESGMDGVVSSVHEVTALKEKFGDDFKVLTPGIRPEGIEKGDQARVATPYDAKKMGSDFIVVGRPITKSNDPIRVVEQILHEIE
ncbi:orotidine-5'-phosphate decarboxylase [bacterium]|nr:orotidine-5'-phosphate decarboxylase [bacterium]MBU1025157.1 orotidine-5'-phosphate decarboxylase [bacterium]